MTITQLRTPLPRTSLDLQTPSPPNFPVLSAATLQAQIDTLRSIVDEATTGATVSLPKLQTIAQSATDPFVRGTLEQILARHTTNVPVTTNETRPVYQTFREYEGSWKTYQKLVGYETVAVTRVHKELASTADRAKLDASLDKAHAMLADTAGADAKIDEAEATGALGAPADTLAAGVARRALDAATHGYFAARTQLQKARDQLEAMRSFEPIADKLAHEHAATDSSPEAREALKWHLMGERFKSTTFGNAALSEKEARTMLLGGERGLVSPLLSFLTRKEMRNHLGEREIAKMVGQADLAAYATSTRDHVLGRLQAALDAASAP